MRVISIDPAPGKKSTIFDGEKFFCKSGLELRSYLAETNDRNPDTLLCWDAPLTGPADPESAGRQLRDFTQRLVERFFMRKKGKLAPPDGISVRPYSGCPHWTITRSLLGLPRTGVYDRDYHDLPFHLLPVPPSEPVDRPKVVEIHPAVAVWLWCRNDDRMKESEWHYKDNSRDDSERRKEKHRNREKFWRIILETTQFPWGSRPPVVVNDDHFDAAVGYILGSMYLKDMGGTQGNPRVKILGNRCTGSFLLPVDSELEECWRAWKNKHGQSQ